MSIVQSVGVWLTGGEQHRYMTLLHCMDHDKGWAVALLLGKIAIFASYSLVAAYLFRRWQAIRKTRFAKAMLYGGVVFVLCATVHLLGGLNYFWPARRLETLLSYIVACVNILFVLQLYKISALEKVLNINAVRRSGGGNNDVKSWS